MQEHPTSLAEFSTSLSLFKRGATGNATAEELSQIKELLLSSRADYYNHLQLTACASVADESGYVRNSHGVGGLKVRLTFSKYHLDFGLGEAQKCSLDKPLHDKIKIVNNGTDTADFSFVEDTSRRHVYVISCTPNSGKVKKGGIVEVAIELRVLCTTRLRELITLTEGGIRHFFTIRLDSQMSQHLDYNELVLGSVIGSGGDGVVKRATWRGLTVAVKQMAPGASANESFEKELAVHKELVHHPNIVHFIGYCLFPNCLIFEFVEGGSLDGYLGVKGPKELSKAYRVKAALDIAQGMAFLHSNGLLHLDLKPQNFLVESLSTSASVNIKLTDFGVSQFAVHTFYGERVEGSFLYIAPEVLKEKKFSAAADVWSFGACLIEIMTDKKPYSEYEQLSYLQVVSKREDGILPMIPGSCDMFVRKVIGACLQLDLSRRPTFEKIAAVFTEMLQFWQSPDSSVPFPPPSLVSLIDSPQPTQRNMVSNSSSVTPTLPRSQSWDFPSALVTNCPTSHTTSSNCPTSHTTSSSSTSIPETRLLSVRNTLSSPSLIVSNTRTQRSNTTGTPTFEKNLPTHPVQMPTPNTPVPFLTKQKQTKPLPIPPTQRKTSPPIPQLSPGRTSPPLSDFADPRIAQIRSLIEETLQNYYITLAVLASQFACATSIEGAASLSRRVMSLARSLDTACTTYLAITWDNALQFIQHNSTVPVPKRPQCDPPSPFHFPDNYDTIIQLHNKTYIVMDQAYTYLQLFVIKSHHATLLTDIWSLASLVKWLKNNEKQFT